VPLRDVVGEPRGNLPARDDRRQVRCARTLVQIPGFDALEIRDVLLEQDFGQQRTTRRRPRFRGDACGGASLIEPGERTRVVADTLQRLGPEQETFRRGDERLRSVWREERVVQVRRVDVEVLLEPWIAARLEKRDELRIGRDVAWPLYDSELIPEILLLRVPGEHRVEVVRRIADADARL